MSGFARWIGLCLVIAWCLTSLSAQEPKQVKQITIHSGWGGLMLPGSTPPRANVVITRGPGGYLNARAPVDPKLVRDLVNALEEPQMTKPDAANLGLGQEWLETQVGKQRPRAFSQATATTPGQQALFNKSFTDPSLIAKAVPLMWNYTSFDDYPGASVEVEFADGSKLRAGTNSYYVFMLPWKVEGQAGETYNADISRAVSALLPAKAVNKERLAGDALPEKLTQAVMELIEKEWDLKGGEDMAGSALRKLRSRYEVLDVEIDPYHHPEYGTATYKGEQEESNLHASLRKATFPPNVEDAVVLEDVKGNVKGVDQFLETMSKYEELALSVPWLNRFIHEHPKATFRISYVHDASFGDKAMRTFAADMALRGRPDLAEKVRAQRKDIALLMVGMTYSESYWLVFPDKHMLLWRYEGPSGLLKFSKVDFREARCADYNVNDGGCPAREVTADGELVAEGTPLDVACISEWREKHPLSGKTPDVLFVIEEGSGDKERDGLMDREGNVVVPMCFEGVGDFSEGLAPFERDGRWGYIDGTGRIVIPPTLPWAEPFHEGLAHVQATGRVLGLEGRWGYIDKTGKLVIPAVRTRIIDEEDGGESAFHEGLAIFEAEGEDIPPKKGFIDKTGKVAIPARFTYVYPFSEGLAAATEDERGEGGWGFIDANGKWVIAPQFEWATSFKDGMAGVNRKKDCGYIDKTGAQVVQLPAPGGREDCASAWDEFDDGLSRWLFGNKYGFVDRTGKTVIAPQFDLTFEFSEGLAAVEVGKKWGYIDTTGKMVIEPQDITDAKPFHNGLARVVREGPEVEYIDKAGRRVWPKDKE